MTVVLPYPLDYNTVAEYLRALKPNLADWKLLHKDAEWKSPVDCWQWHQDNKQELLGP